jgi:hypothetical protein
LLQATRELGNVDAYLAVGGALLELTLVGFQHRHADVFEAQTLWLDGEAGVRG